MLKFEIKFEKEPEEELSMSKIMEDLIAIEERTEDGKGKGKSVILQFESLNMKDYKIEWNSNDKWDVKENLVRLVKAIESLSWVNAVIEVKRTKK